MRSIRAELSVQTEGMTIEDELNWLASQELKDPFLARLRKKAPHRNKAVQQMQAIALLSRL